MYSTQHLSTIPTNPCANLSEQGKKIKIKRKHRLYSLVCPFPSGFTITAQCSVNTPDHGSSCQRCPTSHGLLYPKSSDLRSSLQRSISYTVYVFIHPSPVSTIALGIQCAWEAQPQFLGSQGCPCSQPPKTASLPSTTAKSSYLGHLCSHLTRTPFSYQDLYFLS